MSCPLFGRTKVNGTDIFIGIGYGLDQDNLKQGTPYGKAFHQQVDVKTGEPYLRGYGVYLPVGANMHLAEQLYKFSLLYPKETRARYYALELARFFINCWLESRNRAPLLYHPVKKKFSYQLPDDALFPAFYIGRVSNQRYDDHIDVLGEDKLAFIVEFFPFLSTHWVTRAWRRGFLARKSLSLPASDRYRKGASSATRPVMRSMICGGTGKCSRWRILHVY